MVPVMMLRSLWANAAVAASHTQVVIDSERMNELLLTYVTD
jgi:hypothetical protein